MSTLDRMNSLEQKVGTLEQLFMGARQRITALDQSFVAQASILNDIALTLNDLLPNFNDRVMARIRLREDEEDLKRITSMVEAGALKLVEVSDNESVVALEQHKNGEKLLGHYTVAVSAPDKLVEGKLVGLRSGDTFSSEGFDFKVLAVYAPAKPE